MNDGKGSLLRQGDVSLVPVADWDLGGEPIARQEGRLVLAERKATGHAHVVRARRARLVRHGRPTGRRNGMGRPVVEFRTLLVVEGRPALLGHEEHDPIAVAPGVYEVRRQREYAPAAPRWVQD